MSGLRSGVGAGVGAGVGLVARGVARLVGGLVRVLVGGVVAAGGLGLGAVLGSGLIGALVVDIPSPLLGWESVFFSLTLSPRKMHPMIKASTRTPRMIPNTTRYFASLKL